MAKDTNPLDELKENAERTVKQAVEQTRGALDGYFSFMQKAISSFPSGGTEFGEKLKSYAEQNIAAAQEFSGKLSQARDFQDIIRIQTEFMQAQFKAFGEQTKNLSDALTKTAVGAMKIPRVD
jgi:hypothetical protein